MRSSLRTAFERELTESAHAESERDLARAFRHLERAHVLSQAHAGPHVRVHMKMLTFALRRRDVRELLGQLARIVVAAPGTWLGRAPLGNTGGSKVGIMTTMNIPEDLRAILDAP